MMKRHQHHPLPQVWDAPPRPSSSCSVLAGSFEDEHEGRGRGRLPHTRGFTLIEIMIVCALLAIVLTFSIPRFSSAHQAKPLNRALRELSEACSHARARAILGGRPTQVVFRPEEGSFSVAGGGGGGAGKPGGTRGSGLSGSFDPSLSVEMLDINLQEYRQEPLAVVTFYPNGICDELTVVLRSADNEWRKFSLEGTTGLSTVSNVTDP